MHAKKEKKTLFWDWDFVCEWIFVIYLIDNSELETSKLIISWKGVSQFIFFWHSVCECSILKYDSSNSLYYICVIQSCVLGIFTFLV